MNQRTYWVDVFTAKTWQEFLNAGGEIAGFRESHRKDAQKVKPGDYLLCYLAGVSRFVGVLEVTSELFEDDSPIWSDEVFPCRVKVKPVVKLTAETGVPIHDLKDRLTIFQNMSNPNSWIGRVRGSPNRWKSSDGAVVVEALIAAERDPVVRPVDKNKLARRPRPLKARIGSVTVPEGDVETTNTEILREPTLHEEIQYLLLKLGSDMGLDVWVARNDRGKVVKGKQFASIPRLRDNLPRQFDDATNRTIELIDVLWLKGNAIIAAFEVESTTSIYSGLLRMSDLISMQPNLNIRLYLVAPDERREKVITEVNRPTFSRLSPPMSQVCRYISFESLKEYMSKYATVLRYMKHDILEEISESCEVEEI